MSTFVAVVIATVVVVLSIAAIFVLVGGYRSGRD
jgi:uncharacterized protein (UPF0333 family)